MKKKYLPKKLLVTGGAGFIGSNFIRHYLGAHPEAFIVNLDLLTYAGSLGNLDSLPDMQRYHFVQGNINDRMLVDQLLRDFDIDTIVHFAAESHVDRSIHSPEIFIETNVKGTFTLLEAARCYWLLEKRYTIDQCRFHHISTDEVYGSLSADDHPFSETTPYSPSSPYSASKAASDHLVGAYFSTYQLPVTITQCSNNYGPYQHSEKLIPKVILACLNEAPITVYGTGMNVRDWLYVEDHCRVIDSILGAGTVGENYNIGGETELSNMEVIHHICALMNQRVPGKAPYESLITYGADRPGHDWRYAMDITKIKQEGLSIGSLSFEEGLKKTVAFYCEKAASVC